MIGFYHAEFEALKEQIAREMGHELVEHQIELFGRKLRPLVIFDKNHAPQQSR